MKSEGFTLIELLVSLAIVALIGVMTFSGLSASINSNELTLSRSGITNNLALMDEVLRRDLQHSLNRLSRDERGENVRHSFYGASLTNEGPFLVFTVHYEKNSDYTKGSIRKIEYLLAGSKLIRKEHSYADRTSDTTIVSSTLLKGVEEVQLRFIQNGQWINTWPFMDWIENNGLPQMIEVKIRSERLGEINRRYLLPDGVTL